MSETIVREIPRHEFIKKLPKRLLKKMQKKHDDGWELINTEEVMILDRDITILVFKEKGKSISESKLKVVYEEGLLEDEDGYSTSLAEVLGSLWRRVW